MASPVKATLVPVGFIEFIRNATAQEILDYKLPDDWQERAEELLDKNNAGTLTPDEQIELDQMSEFDLLLMSLTADAYEELDQV